MNHRELSALEDSVVARQQAEGRALGDVGGVWDWITTPYEYYKGVFTTPPAKTTAGFAALTASQKAEFNNLYNEISNRYHTLQGRGADRVNPNEMERIGQAVKDAGRLIEGTLQGDELVAAMRGIHADVMGRIVAVEAQMKSVQPGVLPPRPITPIPGLPTLPEIIEQEKKEWWKAGGIDWRVVGGVAAGIAVVILVMRWRKGKK